MENILSEINISSCTGCGLCEFVCPKKCIKVCEDINGFLKTSINNNLCINCGLCTNVCHLLKENKPHDYKLYGGRSKDIDIVENSRSGGIFYSLAKSTIENGGIAIGATFDNNFEVSHTVVDKLDDLWKLQGSKYVQSTFKNVFKIILENKDKPIIVGGTSCQIASILSFLSFYKLNREKILLVDILCYGVPSKKIFRDYLSDYKHYGILAFDFRDKTFGWESQVETIFTNKGRIASTRYAEMFKSRLILVDNCFDCRYKNTNRLGDISLGDFWGLKEYKKSLYSDEGNSLFFINNNRGEKAFNAVKKEFNYFKVNKAESYWKQESLQDNWQIPSKYKGFWIDYMKHGYKYIRNKYYPNQNKLYKRIIRKGKRMLNILANFVIRP